jgi:ABC-type multidrug transport system fused ATPase/permease subunit
MSHLHVVQGGMFGGVWCQVLLSQYLKLLVLVLDFVLMYTQVAFGYSPDKILYRDVDLGVDLDSRVAIVGPNGAGVCVLGVCV